VLAHDEAQLEVAQTMRLRLSAALGRPFQTEVAPLRTFYLAEDYHQKHRLRGDRQLMAEFRAMYPEEPGFVASTAAAHVNGFLDGFGSPARLGAEIGGLGLTESGAAHLADLARGARG
jgi:peptide-methionine (S)-S-oxide reductase